MVPVPMLARKSILVVDDDHSFSRGMYSLLESLDLDVFIAHNGQEALDLLESINPDVILVDMILPDVSGLSLLRRLRASGSHRGLPIFVTSGLTMSGDRNEALVAGANGFIPKPFSITELERSLNPVLGPSFLVG